MSDISYIVVNGVQYPVEDGTTVNINGTSYTIEELMSLAESPSEQPVIIPQEPTEDPVVTEESSDVSFVVVNGTRYAIDDLQATTDLRALSDAIAEQYDETETYNLGDFCFKDGTLYTCTTAITVPEEWNEDHWASTILSQNIAESQSYNWGSGIAYDIPTNTVSVDVVDDAIEDETRPISSNGVWKELGNVAVLLGTI